MRTVSIVVAACFAVLLAPRPARAQLPTDPEERARVVAQIFENNARELTVYDRQGKVISVVGAKDLYQQPVFSPDGKRLAVIKADIEKETSNVWVLDVATGSRAQITDNASRENSSAPAWSPDGTYVAYVALRAGAFCLYRRPSNASGPEDLLYRHPGGPIILTDWSHDGRFLSFSSNDLSGGILWTLPLDGDRKPVVASRSESQILAPRLSPNSRFIGYRSNESGRNEIWVRPFNPAGGATTDKWQVSPDGGLGMVFWRQDGRELYYFAGDRGIMAVGVNTTGDFEFSRPKLLFKAPDAIPVTGTPGGLASVSRDGERVVFAVPPGPQLRQLAIFDRTGAIVSRVGQPGLFGQPSFSPDGTRIAVTANDRDTGRQDIWAFDVATGKGVQITPSDTDAEANPVWSPDGRYILYVSTRAKYSGIYRKPADGSGAEELLFRYTPGAFLGLTDISPDGKYVTFSSGGVVLVAALTGTDPLARQAVEFSREEYDVFLGRFSPDARLMAYLSNEANSERNEVYVRPFDASSGAASGQAKWQLTKEGADGMLVWRRDGRELFYLRSEPKTNDGLVMSMDITPGTSVQASVPKLLFRLPSALQGGGGQQNVTRDGQRFVFSVLATPRR